MRWMATRNSIVNDGTRPSCASMTTGTRRTMPSRSGSMEKSPRPAAACSIGGLLRSSPGKATRNGRGSWPRIANPVWNVASVSSHGAGDARPGRR
jgi:hypothetical protein